MVGFDFREYLRNYTILQLIGANKTRKQFKNFLRVLYGKKKDRGHIKPKIAKQIREEQDNRTKIFDAISQVIPISIIGQKYSDYYKESKDETHK